MPGPGEYRPDPTEGITRVEDLPQPKTIGRRRNAKRHPCPRCGHRAYGDSLPLDEFFFKNFQTLIIEFELILQRPIGQPASTLKHAYCLV